MHYTSNDPENLAFVEAAAAAEFGISPRRVAQRTWWHVYLPAPEHCTFGRGNPIHDWFRELGIGYLGAHDKRLPDVLYSATDDEIRLFLRHLWATDGCVWLPRGKAAAKVYYASSSRNWRTESPGCWPDWELSRASGRWRSPATSPATT